MQKNQLQGGEGGLAVSGRGAASGGRKAGGCGKGKGSKVRLKYVSQKQLLGGGGKAVDNYAEVKKLHRNKFIWKQKVRKVNQFGCRGGSSKGTKERKN